MEGVNKMSKYGSNIYKRKDGRWEGRYIVGYKNNRSIYKSVYAKNIDELKEKMQCILTCDIEKATTLNELIYSWLCYGKIKNKKSTYDKYSYIMEKHIKNGIGEIRLKNLTSVQVNQFLNDKFKNYSASYVKTMAIIIKSAIEYGHKEQLAELPNIQVNMPFSPKKEVNILGLDEQRQLESYIKNNQSLTALGIMLSLYAGLRIGEVCALRWNNIDFKNRIISGLDHPLSLIAQAFLDDLLHRDITTQQRIDRIMQVTKEDISRVALRMNLASVAIVAESKNEL